MLTLQKDVYYDAAVKLDEMILVVFLNDSMILWKHPDLL